MSKIILKEELGDVTRWELPSVDDVSRVVEQTRAERGGRLPTAEQLEKIQAQAYKEAYEEGLARGLEAARVKGAEQLLERTSLLNMLLNRLEQPYRELDQQVEDELVNLAIAITRQLVRREIKSDPGGVVAVVREALAVLPAASRSVVVHLHPEDLALVMDVMTSAEGERLWRAVEDPTLARGDCKIFSDISQIDATIETRLASIAARLLGGEREEDHDSSRS